MKMNKHLKSLSETDDRGQLEDEQVLEFSADNVELSSGGNLE